MTIAISTKDTADPNGQHLASPAGVLQYTVSLPNAIAEPQVDLFGLQVWPNPSSGDVHIAWDGQAQPGTLRIVNGLGQVVATQVISARQSTAEVHLSAPGIYLVQLASKHGTSTRKIVIR